MIKGIKERINYALLIATLLFFISIIVFVLIFHWENLKLSDIANLATIYASISAVCALVFLAIEAKLSADSLIQNQENTLSSISQSKDNSITTFTLEFLKIYNDSSYNNHLSTVSNFIRDERTGTSEKIAFIEKAHEEFEAKSEYDLSQLTEREVYEYKQVLDTRKRSQDFIKSAKIAFNFFEALGTYYNLNKIDKDIVRRLFRTTAIQNYNNSQWFINKVRQKYGNNIYREWEIMKADLEKN